MAIGLYQDLDIVVSISADTGIVTNIDMVLDSALTLSDTFYSGFGLGNTLDATLSLSGDILLNPDGPLSQELSSLFVSSGVTGTLGNLIVDQDTKITLSNFDIEGTFLSSIESDGTFTGGVNSVGTLIETLTTALSAVGITSSSFGDLDSNTNILCMNVRTFGVSEYLNSNFNSFFNIGSKYYGCSSSGVFELVGDTDSDSKEIIATIKTGVSDFGSQKLKATKDCYVYIRSSGESTLRLIINEQVDRAGYLIPYDYIDGLHRRRIKVAQGLRGTSWQTEFKNTDGSDFMLKQIDLVPTELTRSI